MLLNCTCENGYGGKFYILYIAWAPLNWLGHHQIRSLRVESVFYKTSNMQLNKHIQFTQVPFLKMPMSGPHLDHLNQNLLEYPGICIFKSSPSNCNIQPQRRSTTLVPKPVKTCVHSAKNRVWPRACQMVRWWCQATVQKLFHVILSTVLQVGINRWGDLAQKACDLSAAKSEWGWSSRAAQTPFCAWTI